jgi:hypothetical protein
MNDNAPFKVFSPMPFFEGDNAKAMAGLVADLTPVVGEAKSAVETAEALYRGDYSEAALSAIGILPVIGPKAKAVAKMVKAGKGGGKTVDKALDVAPVSLYKEADTKKLISDFNNDKLPPGLVKGMEESGFDMVNYPKDSMKELVDILKNSPEDLADADQFSRKVLYHVGRNYGVK